MTSRLPQQSGEVIDRSSTVGFTWNGKSHNGYQGDTIASALAADGIRVFSRSLKYHRPRGILTASYLDPNLMLQVGDEPNVRAGHRQLASGMAVESQNTWPSLDFDIKASNQMVGRFLAPGFYYKTFMSPRRLWPAYQKVLRKFANGGTVSKAMPNVSYDKRYAHPDVVVAGGGPSGMAAAIGAAQAGATVLLVEEEHQLGGHLRYGDSDDLAALNEMLAAVAAEDGIEVLTDSVVTGRYDHNWISINQRTHHHVTERLIKARAKVLVVAAGTIERPYVFAGNDLPGVMLSTAVRRLINLYAVKPGESAVVFSANDAGDAAARDLERVGVSVEMVDGRAGGTLVEASGRKGVANVTLGGGKTVAADLLVTATGWTTPTTLLNMAGDRPRYDSNCARYLPQSMPDNVMAAGGMIGDGSTAALHAHGMATGAEAARRALKTRAAWQSACPTAATPGPTSDISLSIPDLPSAPHPALYRAESHGFVDYSEDIKSTDIMAAAEEGYDSTELNKRYTTTTMGPIQGKLEVMNFVAVHSEATGATMGATGTTTWRPPYAPTSLGALAGAHLEPVRHSPMQSYHDMVGATQLVAGQWYRPDNYGDPAAAVNNVRNNVGIIDVSPLGKLDLRGKDVSKLLNFMYTNKWSKLGVGSVRYGVMCAEDGVVFDDGVTGRLGDEHYLMTTTSGGAGRVWNAIEDWLQTGFPEWDVKMTAVTDGLASINIAGPRSRELLGRLTDVDLDPEAFKYMQVRQGTVAGVEQCVIWRIGFTGELSYEIHCPAGYGLDLWNTLLEVGKDLHIAPFGVEAQRIMRLEKGHFIVGQDTDGLTQAFTAGVDWAIKLDKEDFVGKPELVWQSQRGGYARLVGIQPVDPTVVPPEASQIVDGSEIRGRITSSRMSPTLNRSICLGQVDADLSAPGTVLKVRLGNGSLTEATVMEHHAHYDPEGVRTHG